MKKSLLAVAAMTAFAGAAQAQSSVTVYGILDVGFMGGNSTTNVSNAPLPSVKVQGNQFGQSGEQTSRLGFKGTEDLGGGTSAFFTVEFALYPQDANLSGNTTQPSSGAASGNSGLFNRQSFVGLKKNGVGQVALGLQYTPIFNAASATDAGQFNNFAGDAIYSSAAGASGNTSAATSNIGFTNRIANSLTLQSDSFAGFRANAMLTDNNKNASAADNTSGQITSGGNTNASGWGLGADYTYKKFFITGQYQALKQLTSALNYDTANSAIWTASQANGLTSAQAQGSSYPLGQNVQDNQGYIGATYDFGILKAYAQWVTRKATSTVSSNYYFKRSAEQIGVRSFITPTVEAWAQAGLGRYTSFGTNAPTANFNTWQVGSNYWLSKRTNLYAVYGANNQSNATTAAGVTTSYNVSSYGVGVRHTF